MTNNQEPDMKESGKYYGLTLHFTSEQIDAMLAESLKYGEAYQVTIQLDDKKVEMSFTEFFKRIFNEENNEQ